MSRRFIYHEIDTWPASKSAGNWPGQAGPRPHTRQFAPVQKRSFWAKRSFAQRGRRPHRISDSSPKSNAVRTNAELSSRAAIPFSPEAWSGASGGEQETESHTQEPHGLYQARRTGEYPAGTGPLPPLGDPQEDQEAGSGPAELAVDVNDRGRPGLRFPSLETEIPQRRMVSHFLPGNCQLPEG